MAKTKKKSSAEASSTEVTVDRRRKPRRSKEEDRRTEDSDTGEIAEDQRAEPRRKVARRRQIDPTTCERDYNDDEIEFMHALDAYKRTAGRMFPTCSEILEVLRDLGYRRLNAEQLALIEPPEAPVEGEELPTIASSIADGLDSIEGGIEELLDED